MLTSGAPTPHGELVLFNADDVKARLARARAKFEPLRSRPLRIVTPPSRNVLPPVFVD